MTEGRWDAQLDVFTSTFSRASPVCVTRDTLSAAGPNGRLTPRLKKTREISEAIDSTLLTPLLRLEASCTSCYVKEAINYLVNDKFTGFVTLIRCN